MSMFNGKKLTASVVLAITLGAGSAYASDPFNKFTAQPAQAGDVHVATYKVVVQPQDRAVQQSTTVKRVVEPVTTLASSTRTSQPAQADRFNRMNQAQKMKRSDKGTPVLFYRDAPSR